MAGPEIGAWLLGQNIQPGSITADRLAPGFAGNFLQTANNLSDVADPGVSNNNLFANSFKSPSPTDNAFVLDNSYLGSFVNFSNSGTPFTVQIPSGSVGYVILYNEDAVLGTISSSAGTIDGNATVSLAGQETITLFCDGVNYHTTAFGPPSAVLSTTYQIHGTLSSAQLLALHLTPVSLVSGVSGYGILPVSVALEYVYNSIAYTVGVDSVFGFQVPGGGTYNSTIPATGLIDQTNNVISSSSSLHLSNLPSPETYLFNNSGLAINQSGTTITLGNGTMKYWVNYLLIPQ